MLPYLKFNSSYSPAIRLSWDKRQKTLAPTFNSADYYYALFSQNVPPTLHVLARHSGGGYAQGKAPAAQLLSDLERNVPNVRVLRVDGGHDVHLTNPERIAPAIVSFLEEGRKSKL
ncbi:unnamed protein product, partial [Iphiclides podalirius]